MNEAAGLQNYLDLAYNTGSYTPGSTFTLTQKSGSHSYSRTYTVADYSYADSNGSLNLVQSNYLVTATHMQGLGNSKNIYFATNLSDTSQAVRYQVLSWTASSSDTTDTLHGDYSIGRLCKIVTDATPVHAATTSEAAQIATQSTSLVTSISAGVQKTISTSGTTTDVAAANKILTAGASTVSSTQVKGISPYSSDTSAGFYHIYTTLSATDGLMDQSLLNADSGSALLVWNNTTKSYMLMGVASVSATTTSGSTLSIYTYDAALTESTLSSCTDSFTLGSGTLTWGTDGTLTQGGNTVGTVKELAAGKKTWATLEMDIQAWYAWTPTTSRDSGTTNAQLLATHDASFSATTAQTIELQGNVDMGIGRVLLNGGVTYTLTSASGGSYSLESAGYEVAAGTTLVTELTADKGVEWRKIGAGSWYVKGSGTNGASLNLGGTGTTYLERTDGAAAYNVLLNGGTKLVLNGDNQITRDLTFGNGGGTLELNGHSVAINEDAGFTLHSLTDDAAISNSSATVATVDVGMSESSAFLGSISGNIALEHSGSGTWTLTKSSDVNSLSVTAGEVKLLGTPTQHAVLSGSGSTASVSLGAIASDSTWQDNKLTTDSAVTVSGSGILSIGAHATVSSAINVSGNGILQLTQQQADASGNAETSTETPTLTSAVSLRDRAELKVSGSAAVNGDVKGTSFTLSKGSSMTDAALSAAGQLSGTADDAAVSYATFVTRSVLEVSALKLTDSTLTGKGYGRLVFTDVTASGVSVEQTALTIKVSNAQLSGSGTAFSFDMGTLSNLGSVTIDISNASDLVSLGDTAFTLDLSSLTASLDQVSLVCDNRTISYTDLGSGVLLASATPEPATGTLSLLALAALVARRRRK